MSAPTQLIYLFALPDRDDVEKIGTTEEPLTRRLQDTDSFHPHGEPVPVWTEGAEKTPPPQSAPIWFVRQIYLELAPNVGPT